MEEVLQGKVTHLFLLLQFFCIHSLIVGPREVEAGEGLSGHIAQKCPKIDTE